LVSAWVRIREVMLSLSIRSHIIIKHI